MRRLVFFLIVLAASLAAAASADAADRVFLPPKGKVYTGLTGTGSVASFTRETGQKPSVVGFFTLFWGSWEYIFDAAERQDARLMIHLGTNRGYGTKEVITPLGIAQGEGDRYLVGLGRRIVEHGQPVHLRLMAEMNQTNNGYSAFNRDGSSRGPTHSTRAFKQAWRRVTIIMRGGVLDRVNAKLRKLGMKPVEGQTSDLATPKVSMLWVPQTYGSPPIAANSAKAYWPGGRYVDWVGTDFYSKFPNWGPLETFYRDPTWSAKPFVFGEWAVWDGDHGAWVSQFFRWVNTHPRVRMIVYNQGKQPGGPFRLTNRPASRAAARKGFRNRRYD